MGRTRLSHSVVTPLAYLEYAAVDALGQTLDEFVASRRTYAELR